MAVWQSEEVFGMRATRGERLGHYWPPRRTLLPLRRRRPAAHHALRSVLLHRRSMSRVRTFNEPADVPWYGSEGVVDAWLHHLAE